MWQYYLWYISLQHDKGSESRENFSFLFSRKRDIPPLNKINEVLYPSSSPSIFYSYVLV